MKQAMIKTATQEQWDEVDRITQWWIDEQNVTQPDDEIRRAVADFWALMGLSAPVVTVVDSPLSCRIAWSAFAKLIDGSTLDSTLRNTLYSTLYNTLYSTLGNTLGNTLRSTLYSTLGSTLDSTLGNTLGNTLRSTLGNTLGSTLEVPPIAYQSVWWRVWAGWFEGAKALGVQFEEQKYDLFRRWCLCCPYIAGNKKVVFVSRNPNELHWRGDMLHNEDGPAFKYADGWCGYLIDNMILDEQIVMRPETQTIEQIDNEESNDIRAVRLERYGAARYLTETGAKVLDDRANAVEGTHEALLEDKNGQRWLWPTCPSGRICPPLRVPREINSCESASKWVAGSKPFRVVSRT